MEGLAHLNYHASTLHSIGKDLDEGLQTDVVFMDISKAFDLSNRQQTVTAMSCGVPQGSLLDPLLLFYI